MSLFKPSESRNETKQVSITTGVPSHAGSTGYSFLTILLGLAAIPLIALMVSLANDTYRQYKVDTEEAFRTASTIRAISAAQTEQFLNNAKFVLAELSHRPKVQTLDPSSCDPVLTELKQFQPAYANLITLDAKGHLVCSVHGIAPGQTTGPDPKYYFSEVVRTRQFTIGKPAKGFITGRWVSTLAYPIENDAGQLTGVVAIAVDLANYQPVISHEDIPTDVVVGIINSDGVIIARSDDTTSLIGSVSEAESTKIILKLRKGTIRSSNALGIERFYAFAPVANSDWITFVSLDEAAVLAPITRLAFERFAYMLALMLVIVIITTLAARRIAKPIEGISQTMASVDRGAIHARAPVAGPKELRHIAMQLNTMLDLRLKAETKLRESEERYRTAFHTSPDAINITRLSDGLYLDVNDGFTRLVGWTREDVIGKTARDLNIWRHWADRQKLVTALQRDGLMENMETDFVAKDGKIITALMSAHVMTVEGVPCILSVTRDMTDYKAAEEQIKNLAFTDLLTGLPNRTMLIIRLQQALVASNQTFRQGALLLVNLDNFKILNDAFGHDQSDLLLQQVAMRLSACSNAGDIVARLGGDVFVVLLENLSKNPQEAASQAQVIGEKILFALNQPYQIDGFDHHCTGSIGITLFSPQDKDTVGPLKRAELAMYEAKSAGRNSLQFFKHQMQDVASARATLEAALHEALNKNQFNLHYQAQVSDARRIVGVEVLLRWQDPRRGLVPPAEFIPLAEETGLILPIGKWVLESACHQLAQWAKRPEMAHLTVAVNVSARQIHQDDFVNQVLAVLEQTGAKANRLKLELTETMLVANVEDVIAKMLLLKAKGVGFSLDDFGTGYSSLSYLKRLPLDQLKIDRNFVRDILIDPNDAAIAKMVVALANSLGLTVIAEGVETEAQRDFLASLGCYNYQGYLFSRPLPIQEFEAYAQQK